MINASLPWWSWVLMGVGLAVFAGLVAISIRRNRGRCLRRPIFCG